MKAIPVNMPDLTEADHRAVVNCLESGWNSSEGPQVSEFEKLFANEMGRDQRRLVDAVKNCVADHMNPESIFVFDFWHTDAMRNDPPVRRVRTAQVADRKLYRISHPLEEHDRQLIH